MLNIVVPMAGKGSRFADAGYELPKPLIDVNGKHMIEVVINNLKPDCEHRFIFVCQNEHIDKYQLREVFNSSCENYDIIGIDGITEGAAITVLKARDFIDNNEPLMIANSDQWVDININDYLLNMDSRGLDGSMLTMKANDPKWSYAKVDSSGLVLEVIEKVVVSDEATVGIYNFKHGSDFCKFADYMISEDIRSNGEFYVAPVYTFMVSKELNVGIYNIGEEANGMYGLGIPSDLEIFLQSRVLCKAIDF
ncbi:glycosyltransferase family 2 protein [Photobacterium phosphoreum]|uniref:glycosyltransferase family 2 protein n=1 Tax=Photobacterium phosphoreum TaxID=659 RepID=UPI0005D2DFDE|nr:glycosyltransferase family 2 protein [Photobacterium phosphoreum]KJF85816.1 glycosyl transferase family 2 [Photobacterium phosphoreum]PQJ91727.1 glycosyl transferase family 2 [Photobacterium phosphoreum]PSV67101.1 glycosyl transferase family 2 [Photobacterium phosphoreum]